MRNDTTAPIRKITNRLWRIPAAPTRDLPKSEHGGDQRYDKKHDGVMKHGVPFVM